jgi:hypothetical protein
MSQGAVTQQDLDRLSANWPQASKTALREMTQKYGMPMSATPIMAVWQNSGPWKYSIVYGSEVQHSFPAPHSDVLEQFIDYRVPADKVGPLAMFDGSLIVARTPGLLASWCDSEASNFIAINLANEIVTGKTTPEEARQRLAQEAQNAKQGKTSTISQGFMFEVEKGRTGDPDRPVTPTATPGTEGTPPTDLPPSRHPGEPISPGNPPPTNPSNPSNPGNPANPGNPNPNPPNPGSPSNPGNPGNPGEPPTNPGMPR